MPSGGPSAEELPVSVVIPAFNRESTVGRAVASAWGQTCRPAEVIVVDDGSADATAAAATAAGATVITQSNQGVSAARNRGIAAASCEWIALLDSDDEWLPDHLARLWQARGGRVLVSDSLRSGATARVFGNPLGHPLELTSPADVLFPTTPVTASSSMFRRTDALEVGGFPPIPLAEDLEFWCRLLERGRGVSLPEVGAVYHQHGGQASTARAEMRAAVEDLVRRLADRPWMTDDLQTRVASVHLWDELRAALAEGQWARVGVTMALLARPRRLAALRDLWRWRAASRGEAAAFEAYAWQRDRQAYGPRAWAREPALCAVALYRLGRWNDLRRPGWSRWLVTRVYWLAYRPVQTVTGISLDKGVAAGPGLRIHHIGGITVHSRAVLGAGCALRQGVTIGERVPGGPVPVLEDDVDVGAYAQILGGVRIGAGARIGAMALVLEDVPPGGRAFAPRARIEPPRDT